MLHKSTDDTNIGLDNVSEYYRITGLTWKSSDGNVQPRYEIGANGKNVFVNIGTDSRQNAKGEIEDREVQVTLQELVDNYVAMMKTIKMIAPASTTAPAQPARFPLWIDTHKDHQYMSYYDANVEYTGGVSQKN